MTPYYSTSWFFVGLCSVLAGVSAFIFGKLKWGFLARFVPYPVIGGFLAATGYLLTISAPGMMLGHAITIFTIFEVLTDGDILHWLPWMMCAGQFGKTLIVPATESSMLTAPRSIRS